MFSFYKAKTESHERSSEHNSTKWKAIWPDSYAEDCYFSLLLLDSFRTRRFFSAIFRNGADEFAGVELWRELVEAHLHALLHFSIERFKKADAAIAEN
jgi:hypothetical protein